MDYLKSLLGAVGSVIDKAFPAFVGARTKLSVLACPLLGVLAPLVPAPYSAAIPYVQALLCSAAPVFALAGLVRDASDPAKV